MLIKKAPDNIDFEDFVIKELSSVDEPAQAGALAVIIKHTTGATVELDQEMDMDPKELQKKIDELNVQLAKANETTVQLSHEVTMTDSHREHYAKLSGSGKDAFLKMSAAQRDAALIEIEKANEVLYTTESGIKVRKSDSTIALQMAKELDIVSKAAKVNGELADNARFEKQAGDVLGYLPKETSVKVAVLRAIEKGITDEKVRTAALEMFSAANNAAKGDFVLKGRRFAEGEPSNDDADTKLEKYVLVKAKELKIPVEKAEFQLANDGDETYLDLYEQAQDEHRAAHPSVSGN